MLCVFFWHCVSGNPPNCFGVFFPVLLVLGFLREGFFGTSSRAGVGPAAKSSLFVSLVFLEFSFS